MATILSILGSVGFNWHVALANFLNFLIILFILNKFFFGKLGKTISERKSAIEKGLADAEEAAKALARAEDEKKEIIHEAKKESHAIVSEAQTQAELLAASIKEKAEQEAATKMLSLSEKEANLKEKVEKDIAEALPMVVAKLYAKTLRKNMTESQNNELIASLK